MGGAISSQPLSVSAILAAFAWNWVQAVQLHIISLPTYDNITQGGITIYDWTWLLLNFHTHTPISPHPHTQPHTHIPTSPHSLSIPPLCFVSILHRSRFHYPTSILPYSIETKQLWPSRSMANSPWNMLGWDSRRSSDNSLVLDQKKIWTWDSHSATEIEPFMTLSIPWLGRVGDHNCQPGLQNSMCWLDLLPRPFMCGMQSATFPVTHRRFRPKKFALLIQPTLTTPTPFQTPRKTSDERSHCFASAPAESVEFDAFRHGAVLMLMTRSVKDRSTALHLFLETQGTP